jgi:hypothetical protein
MDITSQISRDIATYRDPSSAGWTLYGLFRVMCAVILLGCLVIWGIFSISNESTKKQMSQMFQSVISTGLEWTRSYSSNNNTNTSSIDSKHVASSGNTSTSSASASSMTSSVSSSASSSSASSYGRKITSDPSSNTIMTPDDIEKSTNAINTALNYTSPKFSGSGNDFHDDAPSSNIQSGHPRGYDDDLWWYIDTSTGIPGQNVPLPNAFDSSSSNPVVGPSK